jgi:hypothetical protein
MERSNLSVSMRVLTLNSPMSSVTSGQAPNVVVTAADVVVTANSK